MSIEYGLGRIDETDAPSKRNEGISDVLEFEGHQIHILAKMTEFDNVRRLVLGFGTSTQLRRRCSILGLQPTMAI